jgi:hypothetical protein
MLLTDGGRTLNENDVRRPLLRMLHKVGCRILKGKEFMKDHS